MNILELLDSLANHPTHSKNIRTKTGDLWTKMNDLSGVENSGKEICFQGIFFCFVLPTRETERRRFLGGIFHCRVSTGLRPEEIPMDLQVEAVWGTSEVDEIFDYYRKVMMYKYIYIYLMSCIYIDNYGYKLMYYIYIYSFEVVYIYDIFVWYNDVCFKKDSWLYIATVDGWNLVITTCDVQTKHLNNEIN